MKNLELARTGKMVLSCMLALAASGSLADDQSEESTSEPLTEIVVKGQVLDNTNLAYSSTRFDAEAVREFQPAQVQELFDQVPGMSIRNFGLGGVADSITIRGFGGGGHGGDLGVVLDGIPLNEAMSHSDGYVDLNVIVPLEVSSMTVFKGPVSALYGNFNRGGLVRIDTRRGGDYALIDASTGSNSLLDVQGALGMAAGERHLFNFAAQHFRNDGFRPQSDSVRSTLAGGWTMDPGTRTTIGLSARLHTADSDNASYLTEPQYRSDPYGIDPGVQNDGAEKDFGTVRADFNYDFSDSVKLLSFAYVTEQDFSRWFSRPVGDAWRQREETYDRDVFGASVSLSGQSRAGGVDLSWVVGAETFDESTYYQYYDGLDNRERTGPAINDRVTDLDSVSAFAELQADVHPLFMPSVGFRYDDFGGDCTLRGPEQSSAPCESLNDIDNLSPKLGFRSQVSDSLQFRASWSEGFALPNGWVKYQSQAANLDPVEFRQIEVGVNWTPLPALSVDIAAFELESSGEVRTLAPGEFENYGETERTGVEATVSWLPSDNLSFSAVYGVTDTEIVLNDNPDLIGNEVGGISDYSANLIGVWRFQPSWRADFTWRAVGGFPLNAENTVYSDSFETLDLGLTYLAGGQRDLRVFARVENVTDEVYAPTAFLIGGAPLYGPGPPRLYRVGLQFGM
jgi:outer membrane receptor protein involved in Fe transport